jgi:hypothetical protein
VKPPTVSLVDAITKLASPVTRYAHVQIILYERL